MNNVPIAVVDDHPLMLEALVSLLSHSAFGVVATGTTASDITRIAQQFRPEVMVVDLSMVGDAFEAIAAVVKTVPETKIVAFTAATGVQPAIRALEAGARGYVLKRRSIARVPKLPLRHRVEDELPELVATIDSAAARHL